MPVPTPSAMLADKGYDGNSVREALLMRGILPIIPPKANRTSQRATLNATKIVTMLSACSASLSTNTALPPGTIKPLYPISAS